MAQYANRACALGVDRHGFFTQGVCLPLGPFGAVVIGRNGAGKTRFASAIGRSIDVIFDPDPEQRVRRLFSGLINPSDREQPWSTPDDDNILYRNPAVEFEEVVRFLEEDAAMVAQQALSNNPSIPLRRAWSTILTIEAHEIPKIAVVFTSLSIADSGREWSHFPYLLASTAEICRHGQLGVSYSGDEKDARLRLWFNVHPETTPVLCEVIRALGTYDGLRATREIAPDADDPPQEAEELVAADDEDGGDLGGRLGHWTRIFDDQDLVAARKAALNDDLRQLADQPATLHRASPTLGPFEYSTPPLPLGGFPLGRLVIHCDDTELPFEGAPVELDPTAEVSFNRLFPGDRHGCTDRSYRFRSEPEHGWYTGSRSTLEESVNIQVSLKGTQPEYRYSKPIWQLAAAVSHLADAVLHLLLPSAPHLFLVDRDGSMGWMARQGNGAPFPVADLSYAQLRWARMAAIIATRYADRIAALATDPAIRDWIDSSLEGQVVGLDAGLPGDIVVIDEPERGLHRSAERPLAEAIVLIAELTGFKPVVVTHSPTFIRTLTNAGANTFWVHLDENGESRIESFDPSDLRSLGEASGLSTQDVLHLTRVFLLVEGDHDQAVLTELFGREFADLGVVVIPIRGVHGSPQVVDSTFLWNFTDARVVLMLDHLDDMKVQQIWDSAVVAYREAGLGAAIAELSLLDKIERSGQAERRAVKELLVHALERAMVGRIEIVGLLESDIINYFHPLEILRINDGFHLEPDRRAAWKQLEKQWRKAATGKAFKPWLEHQFPGTELSGQSLARAASGWDRIPDDFQRLLNLLAGNTSQDGR